MGPYIWRPNGGAHMSLKPNVFFVMRCVKVPVQYELVSEQTRGVHCCKPWLTVLPTKGFIHISVYFCAFSFCLCTVSQKRQSK